MVDDRRGVVDLGPVLAALAAQDVSAVPVSELGEQVVELDRAVASLTAEKLRRLAVFHAADGGAADGAQSTAAWLRYAVRAGHRDAAAQVRTAVALTALPATAAALAGGDISPAHAAAMAPVLTTAAAVLADGQAAVLEGTLLTLARAETVDRLTVAARQVALLLDPDGTLSAEERAHDRRWLSTTVGPDGTVYLRGLLDPDGGAVVKTALEAVTPPPRPGDGRTRPQAHADGLVDLCAAALRHGDLPTGGGHRPQLTLVADLDTLHRHAALDRVPVPLALLGPTPPAVPPPLRGHRHRGRDAARRHAAAGCCGDPAPAPVPAVAVPAPAVTAGGGPLGRVGTVGARLGWTGPVHAETARRIACDATVTRLLLDPTGQPLHLGRARRRVTPAQWTALVVRDGGCIFPGCHRPPAWCDAHHVKHWLDGGPTDLDNLVLLCRYHHRHVHEQDWTITRHHDGRYTLTPPPHHMRR